MEKETSFFAPSGKYKSKDSCYGCFHFSGEKKKKIDFITKNWMLLGMVGLFLMI